jgi:hypothetical protein
MNELTAEEVVRIVGESGIPTLARALRVTVAQAELTSLAAHRHLRHGTPFSLPEPTVTTRTAVPAVLPPQGANDQQIALRVQQGAILGNRRPTADEVASDIEEARRQEIYTLRWARDK